MPRDLFGDVTDPSIKVGTRKWYSVPLSLIAHTLAVGVVVVAPLVATGALPMPSSDPMVVLLDVPRLPEPPPARRAAPPTARVNPEAAPVVAPDAITAEPALLPSVETSGVDLGLADISSIEGAEVIGPPPAAKIEQKLPDGPLRVGGGIRQPQRVSDIPPEYPAIALAARVRGLVIIEATIDTAGRVRDARVLRSDSPLLNDAALTAVRRWVYTPTLLNGVPVSVIMTVTVNFEMQ